MPLNLARELQATSGAIPDTLRLTSRLTFYVTHHVNMSHLVLHAIIHVFVLSSSARVVLLILPLMLFIKISHVTFRRISYYTSCLNCMSHCV